MVTITPMSAKLEENVRPRWPVTRQVAMINPYGRGVTVRLEHEQRFVITGDKGAAVASEYLVDADGVVFVSGDKLRKDGLRSMAGGSLRYRLADDQVPTWVIKAATDAWRAEGQLLLNMAGEVESAWAERLYMSEVDA